MKHAPQQAAAAEHHAGRPILVRAAVAVGRFCYDFIIGDDWKIAAAVLVVLAGGAVLVAAGLGASALFAPLLAVGSAAGFAITLTVDLHHSMAARKDGQRR